MKPHLLLLSMALAASGCAQHGEDSLETFFARSGDGLRGSVASIPQARAAEPVAYTAARERDPFDPGRAAPAPAPVEPDTRPREPLEAFGLETLRMTGTIRQGAAHVALVRAPDGFVHRVSVGSYLGLNSGRITGIDDAGVTLAEPGTEGESRVVVLAIASR